MNASQNIKQLIKGWEGLRTGAYRCPAGVLTIGYGHIGPDVTPGKTITQAEADRLFEQDIARLDAELQSAMKADNVPPLTQGRYDALLSFAFNLGLTKLRGSTLWRKVVADPADPSIPSEFARWVYGTVDGRKVRLPGLVKRRAEEARVYNG